MGNINFTGLDALIAGLIVLFDEFIIKRLIFKKSEKYALVYRYAPIVLGVITYIVMALIQKAPVWNNVMLGFAVGLGAMGSYDAILKLLTEKGVEGIKAIIDAILELLKKKESK